MLELAEVVDVDVADVVAGDGNTVLPLAVAGLGGLGVSAGANLLTQFNSRKLYRRSINAYRNMYSGYSRYLATHGRSMNNSRKWLSYYGQGYAQKTNLKNSYIGSLGTAGGTFGAGAMMTSRWL